jgi:hypothetical protein
MKPSKDFSTRFAAAQKWRDDMRPKIEEAYRFCAPGRENEFSESRRKSSEDTTTFHSLGEESASDLAGDLVTYFTPPEADWLQLLVTTEVPEEMAKAVLEAVTQREQDLMDYITASNYYDVAPQWGFEAATHGTPGMWVQMAHMAQPIHCETVPPCELYITPGHLGYLDRFRKKKAMAETLPVLLMGYDVNLDDSALKEKMKKPGVFVDCVWGFWLDWTDPGYPRWLMEITIDGKRVTEEKVVLGGIGGSCPLLVGRFNPQPNTPWGRGPAIRALPDMRVLDKIEETVLLGLEDAISNTLIYSNDGYLDLSEGLVAGTAYPAGPRFSKDQIFQLNKSTNLEVGFFTREDMERRIRSTFYQDGPRQRGDTPPTAAQWFDEARRVQQKLGKPSAPLRTEFVNAFVQRVEYLAIQAGLLPDAIVLDGRNISVQISSPLQKAQNRDDVMTARSNLEMAAATMGEAFPRVVDMTATFQNVVKASGDRLTVIRKEEAPVEQAPAGPTG